MSRPKNIIFSDFHNFAGVTDKMMESLGRQYNVYSFGKKPMSKEEAKQLFKAKNTLLIYVEPWTLQYTPNADFDDWLPRTYNGVKIPKNMPFGIWWSGSIYRVDNHAKCFGLKQTEADWFKRRRNYYNTLTKLKFVGTDDLLSIDESAYFVGQPILFPKKYPNNIRTKRVIHIPSSPVVTNVYKGTDLVASAFEETSCDITSDIIEKQNHDKILSLFSESTMSVQSMTDWSCGLGYTGLESIVNGCMVLSKMSGVTNHEIVHVETQKELVNKILYYNSNDKEREEKARKQFVWAKNNFSYNAFRKRFTESIDDCIKGGSK